MGYYAGSGVIVSGSHTFSEGGQAMGGAFLMVERETKTTSTVKNGVSLTSAQSSVGGGKYRSGFLAFGSYQFPSTDCSGLQINYQYTQINGSNLYQLIENRTQWRSTLHVSNGGGVMSKGPPSDWIESL